MNAMGEFAEQYERVTGPRRARLLTDRQLQVLELVAEGFCNEEIGRRLDPPARLDSVKQIVKRLLRNLGDVRTRTQLVSVAYQRGLLDPRTGRLAAAVDKETWDAAWEKIKEPLPHRHAYVTIDGVTEYGYLAPACVHAMHSKCEGMILFGGERYPVGCPICQAPCQCPCHG